jgi:hypothetical protein
MFQVCAELGALKSLITGLEERSCKSWGIRPAVAPGTSSLGGIAGVFAKMLASWGCVCGIPVQMPELCAPKVPTSVICGLLGDPIRESAVQV